MTTKTYERERKMTGRAVFEGVPRRIFNQLCDALENCSESLQNVSVYYDGTNIGGTVTIFEMSGSPLAYKNALAKFIECYFE